MKTFQFDPQEYRNEYAAKGYLHIKNGVSTDFIDYVKTSTQELLANKNNSLSQWHYKDKKRQYLFEFPDDDTCKSLLTDVAHLAGLCVKKTTLCERHIKAYEDVAEKMPAPHKDRLQSEATVGLPIVTSPESYLFAYPHDQLAVNPFSSSAQWRSSLDEADLPEAVLQNIEPVRLYAQPGDVVVFRGSSIYHDRANPANTIVLYFKINGMRLDPAGEDPSTPLQRERSLEILNTWSDEELLHCRLEVSPRLDRISRHYTRLYWKEVIQANIWGEKEFTISEIELQVFKNAEPDRTVDDILSRLGIPHGERKSHLPMFRRLGQLGGIDLLGR